MARRQLSGLLLHMLLLQLEGRSVPDVVADVLLVDQDLVDGAARPCSPKIGENASLVEACGDLALDFAIFDESAVDPADRIDLLGGPRNKYNAIGLDALVFAAREFTFDIRTLIDEAAAQPKARRSALTEPKFDQAALTGEYLCR